MKIISTFSKLKKYKVANYLINSQMTNENKRCNKNITN